MRQWQPFLISINNLSLFLIPEIMFGLIIPKKPHNSIENISDISEKDLQEAPLKKVEYLTDISYRIDQIMNLEQPFLNKDFKLHNLAIALDVPDHHLASCLRNIRETTFTDLKNLYRINAFKDRIENGAFNTLTIDALREECGFQSKSSFFSAFQKQEGMTPMAYISKK
jgi:AraC-like DNA-binding protein